MTPDKNYGRIQPMDNKSEWKFKEGDLLWDPQLNRYARVIETEYSITVLDYQYKLWLPKLSKVLPYNQDIVEKFFHLKDSID